MCHKMRHVRHLCYFLYVSLNLNLFILRNIPYQSENIKEIMDKNRQKTPVQNSDTVQIAEGWFNFYKYDIDKGL